MLNFVYDDRWRIEHQEHVSVCFCLFLQKRIIKRNAFIFFLKQMLQKR